MADAQLDSQALQPSVYFPVSATEYIEPSQPLPPDAPVLEADRERAFYLAQKRQGRGSVSLETAPAAAAMQRAAACLRGHMAALAPFHQDHARLAQLDLDGLLLELQEDVVIMLLPHGFAPERARAAYLHVSFPAGWDPGHMLGKSFPALHARVPRESGFTRADQPRHAASLFERVSFRHVWSLTPDATLDRHPAVPRTASWQDTQQAFLRVERQLSIPLGADDADKTQSALFVMRTFVYPLSRLSVGQRQTLLAALGHMSEGMRRYKGMFGHEARISELLAAG